MKLLWAKTIFNGSDPAMHYIREDYSNVSMIFNIPDRDERVVSIFPVSNPVDHGNAIVTLLRDEPGLPANIKKDRIRILYVRNRDGVIANEHIVESGISLPEPIFPYERAAVEYVSGTRSFAQ